ncbi:hypothetical protein RDn1_067 [Candidatus Termititenax dinenymphae]|uniref:Uncharacterized protein n=1 Tax=Candidatus Termititenax dinenymphae TaxID=2218523 RepID=A0A388TJC5_9BACT|nr:hypothetical protein RDn1_067 [Candidatus Termititenax dinenymphae]
MFYLRKIASFSEQVASNGISLNAPRSAVREIARNVISETDRLKSKAIYSVYLENTPEIRDLFRKNDTLRVQISRGSSKAEVAGLIEEISQNNVVLDQLIEDAVRNEIIADMDLLVYWEAFFEDFWANPEPDSRRAERMAHTFRPRLQKNYDRLSDYGKELFDMIIKPLALEYELGELFTKSEEISAWYSSLKETHTELDVASFQVFKSKLYSKVGEFIIEKNMQEAKEEKLLEKFREELAGFGLPKALRHRIADMLGLRPEDLDPAVLRRIASETI